MFMFCVAAASPPHRGCASVASTTRSRAKIHQDPSMPPSCDQRPSRSGRAAHRISLALAAAALLGLPGCKSAAEQRESADRQVYAILAERRAAFAEDPAAFTIEPDRRVLRELLDSAPNRAVGPLDLIQVLALASATSREYQERKERLYLVALDLTLERYRFQVQTTGTLGALVAGTGDDAQLASVDGGLGFTRLLGTGALIVGDIGLSLFRSLTTGDGFDAISTIGLSVTQPLLRGAGRRIVLEPLTQAERDVVYEVRAFERFRRTFAFDVTADYFAVLQAADVVDNERANYANLQILRRRNEALAEAGRLSDIQVDQALQDELRSRNRLIQAEQGLENRLDSFKLQLGLPIDLRLELSSEELERLAELAADVDYDRDALIALALRERLDYLTVLDQIDDAQRDVVIAADALRSALDVSASALAISEEGRPLDLDANDVAWDLRLDLDLAIDRLPERNLYRASLVFLERARRDAELLADTIRVSLLDSLRGAQASREAYEIQLNAVELAETRVESTRLSLEAGRADTRDILEAQEALVEAQNAATNALIDFHLATLALYRDIEALRLEEQGLVVDERIRAALAEMAQ
jgi:outer membrane protein TolC